MSADDILRAADVVATRIRQQDLAGDTDTLRRLPRDIVDLLREAGVFRMNMPHDRGGPELTSMDQVRVVESLARADASVAWCSFIWADSGIYSGYLDEQAALTLYPELDMAQSGWIYPMGRAQRMEEGYRVSGRWMFGSGIDHCDVLAAGCTVFDGDEPHKAANGRSEWRVMLAKREGFTIEDTWHTTGLRGTGSHHYRAEDLFVPIEHSFSFLEPKRQGPIWRRPDTLVRKMCGVPLGLARAAIDEGIAVLGSKTDRLSGHPYHRKTDIQRAVALAEGQLGAARAYVFDALEAQWQKLERALPLTPAERAGPVLARYNAFQMARDVTRLMYDAVGGQAVYEHSRFDRYLRDAMTMCQHIVGQPKSIDPVGAMLLGGDVSNELFLGE